MAEDQQRPYRHVEPLDVDAVRTVQIGTALWAVALVLTLVARDALQDEGRTWWIWTCATGVVLGLLGLVITMRRRRRITGDRSRTQRS